MTINLTVLIFLMKIFAINVKQSIRFDEYDDF